MTLRDSRITCVGSRAIAVTGRATALTALPWVGHRSRRWEPEPLRWVGANLGLSAMTWADRAEQRTGRPSRIASGVNRLIGR